MITKTYNIKGMHCRSCELILEDSLGQINGVKQVKINYKTGLAEIGSQTLLNDDKVKQVILASGYEMLNSPGQPNNFADRLDIIKDLLVGGSIIGLLYVIFRHVNLSLPFNISTTNQSLGAVLLVGLTAGFSTCMAIVGGLVLGISSSYSRHSQENSFLGRFQPQLLFNIGRLFGFLFLGGIAGLIGSVFQTSNTFVGLLTVFVGLYLLFLGLQLTGLFPFLEKYRLTIPKNLSKKLRFLKTDSAYSKVNTLIAGALTFFLPCGFTQAMQILAISTGDFFTGGLIMLTFAVGTAPGLLSLGGFSSALKTNQYRIFRFIALILFIMGVFNINNALGLLGLKPVIAKTTQNTAEEIVNGTQIIRMEQKSNGYYPNVLFVTADRPVRWIITSSDSYSCASSFVVPELKIKSLLKSGENIFDFTPTKEGVIRFSCSMGMYTGQLVVSMPGKSIPTISVTDQVSNQTGNTGCSGCGGCGGDCGGSSCGCGGKR